MSHSHAHTHTHTLTYTLTHTNTHQQQRTLPIFSRMSPSTCQHVICFLAPNADVGGNDSHLSTDSSPSGLPVSSMVKMVMVMVMMQLMKI